MTDPKPALTRDQLAALLGDVDDSTIAAILAIGPSEEELEEALAWAVGESDVMGEQERSLSGKAARIYDILIADQYYENER